LPAARRNHAAGDLARGLRHPRRAGSHARQPARRVRRAGRGPGRARATGALRRRAPGMSATPQAVGIVGSAGAYGRWLTRFFTDVMQLRVIGHDAADPSSQSPEELLAHADVLVFSAPIRHTPALVAEYVERAAGRERGRLWLDVTSVKEAPVQAMLASQADVVGLHPMTAPPKAPTLKGRVMVVCEARVQR